MVPKSWPAKITYGTLPSIISGRYSIGKWYLKISANIPRKNYLRNTSVGTFYKYSFDKWNTNKTLPWVLFIGIPSVNGSKNVEKMIRLVPLIFRR